MVESKNLEELLKEPQESLKWKVNYTWFCAIFNKKKNRPLFTFDTLEGFTEEHWKAIALMKWAMWEMDKKLFKVFREFINQTWELNDEAKLLVFEFDKRFRILVNKD